VGTTTLATLHSRLAEQLGDFISVSTAGTIAASATVAATALNSYDEGKDNFFNGYFLYFSDATAANYQTGRYVADYASTSGTLTVYGPILKAETVSVAIKLYRPMQQQLEDSINDSIREIYPSLHEPILNMELVTGNILPPFNWTASTVSGTTASSSLAFYTATNATILETTTGGEFRYEPNAAKITASTASGYLSIHSDNYPDLLDLMDNNVTARVWALASSADDVTIDLRTKQADATAQSTLISTTEAPADEFTLLELEDQVLNDDLVEVELKLTVATKDKYAFFDLPRLYGTQVLEYQLPQDLQDGQVLQVYVQTTGYSDDICDDINPNNWERVWGYEVFDKEVVGTRYKYLRLPALYSDGRRIQLVGVAPLSTLTNDTDTIEIDGEKVNLLIAYAKYKYFQRMGGYASAQDTSRYKQLMAEAYAEYMRLSRTHRMVMPRRTMNLPYY